MVDECRMIDGKKYMWDGKTYDSNSEASETRLRYERDGFETEIVMDEGKYFVYTRRVVTDIVIEGEAPV